MVSGEGCGYSIFEKDCNGDVLCTWTYPSLNTQQRDLAARKCRFDGLDTNFLYGQFRGLWYYIGINEAPDPTKLPKVRQFSVCIWAKQFNPEKFEALSRVMGKKYNSTGDQVSVMEIYLAATTAGKVNDPGFLFNSQDFPKPSTNLKEIIINFGLESIIIYTAVLLKKRIVIYHHDMSTLLKAVRSIPAFVSDRDPSSTLFPCIDLHKDEILNLKSYVSYVAGCRDANITSSDLFDVFVHLPAREISIAPNARESMGMTRTHKEIAFFLVQLSQNESLSEEQLVAAVSAKTNELREQLRTLATTTTAEGKSVVTLESLRQNNFPHAMENFLFNFAVAENIMML